MKKNYKLKQEEFKKLTVTGQTLRKRITLHGIYIDMKYGYTFGYVQVKEGEKPEGSLNMMFVRIENGMLNHINVTGLIMKKRKHYWLVKDNKENRKKAKRYDDLHFVESMVGAIQ
jgi:hypothetical protein